MSAPRYMIAGRVSGDPMSLPGEGELVMLRAPNGATWAALRKGDLQLARPLVDGDAVAVVGTIDPTRKSSNALNGPIMVDALLGLGADGDILGLGGLP